MSQSKYLYEIWMAERLGYGSKCAGVLLSVLESAKDIYNMQEDDFYNLDIPFDEQSIFKVSDIKALCNKDLTNAKKIINDCIENNINIVSILDDNYPDDLRHIYSPPAILYYQGSLPNFNNQICFTIIGTRNFTKAVAENALEFSYNLSKYGFVIVSGLAKGIDSKAHIGAIKAGGVTIGIAGCGLDVDYPKGNGAMKKAMLEKGAIISEFPPKTPPNRENFPIRNRILSGLSKGVLVIESALKGGSLITASLALEQGRDVFAIPGNINIAQYAGCNNLIKNGAKLTTDVYDIIEEYHSVYSNVLDLTHITNKRRSYNQKLYDEKIDEDYIIEIVDYSKMADEIDGKLLYKQIENDYRFNGGIKNKNSNELYEKNVINKSKTKKLVDESKLTEIQRLVIKTLEGTDKKHIDDIACEINSAVGKVSAALTTLEIYGYVQSMPGKHYSLN